MAKKLISYDDEAEGLGLPDVVEQRLDGRYFPATGGAVVGNGVTRMTVSSDPNYIPEEGEFTILLGEPALPTASEDFSGYTAGVAPDGWSRPWVATPEATVVDDALASDGRSLQILTGGTTRGPVAWDSASSISEESQEVVMRVMIKSRDDMPRIVLRGTGVQGSESGYWLGRNSNLVSIGRYSNGVSTTLRGSEFIYSQDEWYRMRARVEGSIASLKVWLDSEAEPDAWNVTYDDDSPVINSGFVGLMAFGGSVGVHVDWVGAGFGGATAPMKGEQ